MSDKRTKEAVAARLYQKFAEHFFDHSEAEYFLDCLTYLSGDDSSKEKAIKHIGEDFINECLEE